MMTYEEQLIFEHLLCARPSSMCLEVHFLSWKLSIWIAVGAPSNVFPTGLKSIDGIFGFN